jgi:hypothetical protein
MSDQRSTKFIATVGMQMQIDGSRSAALQQAANGRGDNYASEATTAS